MAHRNRNSCITFLPFIFLVKLHNRLFYEKEYLEKKIEINQQELQAINYDTSSFDGGRNFTIRRIFIRMT